MLLGNHGRIIRDIRERATQLLIEKIQRPVSMFVEIKVRRKSIGVQNKQDTVEGIVKKKQRVPLPATKPIELKQD